MAYNLFAVIGRAHDVAGLDHPQLLGRVDLVEGYALRPLDVDWLEEESEVHPRQFDDVVTLIGDAMIAASAGHPIAYDAIETFGGSLEVNGAAVWSEGAIVHRDLVEGETAEGRTVLPCEEALALIGVVAMAGHDAFDTLGLGRYRSTEEWR